MSWKKRMIGGVDKMPPDEFERFKLETLNKPLEWGEGICRCVCTKCQNVAEINEEFVTGLLNTMALLGTRPETNIRRLTDFQKWYFEVGYCDLCGPGELSVEFKMIKNRPE